MGHIYTNLFVTLCWPNMNDFIKIGNHIMEETLNKTVQNYPLHLKYVLAVNLKRHIEPTTQYLHAHFNESLNSYKHDWQLLSQNRHIILTSYARNVCLQHKHKHRDTGATSPTARSMNSVIQTVHSFLMRRLSSSTSEILQRAGGGHFENVM